MDIWLRILRQQTSYAQGGTGTSLSFNSNDASSNTKITKAKSKSALETELDKVLTELNRLETTSSPTEETPVSSRPTLIMSSDAEISLGKTYAPPPPDYVPKTMSNDAIIRTRDREIVVGVRSHHRAAISYMAGSEDEEDCDERDLQLLAETANGYSYGSGTSSAQGSIKRDGIADARANSATRGRAHSDDDLVHEFVEENELSFVIEDRETERPTKGAKDCPPAARPAPPPRSAIDSPPLAGQRKSERVQEDNPTLRSSGGTRGSRHVPAPSGPPPDRFAESKGVSAPSLSRESSAHRNDPHYAEAKGSYDDRSDSEKQRPRLFAGKYSHSFYQDGDAVHDFRDDDEP